MKGIYCADTEDEKHKEILKKCEWKAGRTNDSNQTVQKATEHHESVCEASEKTIAKQ